ncbi:MAG: radical SAM protein, partial [Candidatus Sumerlaeia bacterium]|nr:radical SAM protein [Candidatus Sumerlaeia bacterium]
GVETIELGVQSFDDEVLRLSRRGYNSASIIRSAQLITTANFKLSFHLMVGLPGDTPQKTLHSTQMTILLKPQFVRIHPTLVLTGTELQQMYERGEYVPWSEETMVATLTEMMIRFTQAGIKVIRLGIQPSRRMLTESAIIAGLNYTYLQKLRETPAEFRGCAVLFAN